MRLFCVARGLTRPLLLCGVAACSIDHAGEAVGNETSPIYLGTPDPTGPSSKFPAVGGLYLGGTGQCTATLIAVGDEDPQIALTAAHCLPQVGYCTPYFYFQPTKPGDPPNPFDSLVMSFPPSGSDDSDPKNGGTAFGIDGIVWHPDFIKPDAVACCGGNFQGCFACDGKNDDKLKSWIHDVALVHLERPVVGAKGMKLVAAIATKGPLSEGAFAIQPSTWPAETVATVVGVSATKPGGDYGHRTFGPVKILPDFASKLPNKILESCNDAVGQKVACDDACQLRVSADPGAPLDAAKGGACPVSGDSGSPLVINDTAAGGTAIAGLPAGTPFVVGVLSRGNGGDACAPAPPNGHTSIYTTTWDFAGKLGAAFDDGNGRFVLDHLKDFDGDAVPNQLDNCPLAPNTDQANCNEDAEVANGYPKRGDACDPIPCPTVTLPPGTVKGISIKSKFVWAFDGRMIRDQLDVQPLGSSFVRNGMVNGKAIAPIAVPEKVKTDYRFCEINGAKGIECGPEAIDDTLIDKLHPGNGPNPDFPYLRANMRKLGQFNAFSQEALSYPEPAVSRRWLYQFDYFSWFNSKQIDAMPACDPNAFPLPCTDLDGRFWTHARTTRGTYVDQLGTGYRVKTNGTIVTDGKEGLANHYFFLQPDAAVSSHGAFLVFVQKPFFLWKTLPDPAPWWDGFTREDAYLVGLPGGSYGLARAGGRAIAVDAYLGSDLKSRLADPTLTWAAPVEPHLTAATTAPTEGFHALVFAANGTDVIEGVLRQGGMLGTTVDFVRPPPIRPGSPSPRKDFTTVFTRAEDRAFVIGGKALANDASLHDVWLRPVQGAGEWSEVALQDFALGDVLAATWSYRDHRLWLLDERLVGGSKVARLVRIDVYRGVVTPVGEWPRKSAFQRQWLWLDRDGVVLLAATSENHHAIARFEVPPLAPHGTIAIAIAIDAHPLAFAPIADGDGYSLPLVKELDLDEDDGDPNDDEKEQDKGKNEKQKNDKQAKDKNDKEKNGKDKQPQQQQVLSVERKATLGLQPASLLDVAKIL